MELIFKTISFLNSREYTFLVRKIHFFTILFRRRYFNDVLLKYFRYTHISLSKALKVKMWNVFFFRPNSKTDFEWMRRYYSGVVTERIQHIAYNVTKKINRMITLMITWLHKRWCKELTSSELTINWISWNFQLTL